MSSKEEAVPACSEPMMDLDVPSPMESEPTLDLGPPSPIDSSSESNWDPGSPPPPSLSSTESPADRLDRRSSSSSPSSPGGRRRRQSVERLEPKRPRRRGSRFSYGRQKHSRRQITVHRNVVGVLCVVPDGGFTLSDGRCSISVDGPVRSTRLSKDVRKMQINRLYLVDFVSYEQWMRVKSEHRRFVGDVVEYVTRSSTDLEPCTFCGLADCHRWKAIVGGVGKYLNVFVDPIRHADTEISERSRGRE